MTHTPIDIAVLEALQEAAAARRHAGLHTSVDQTLFDDALRNAAPELIKAAKERDVLEEEKNRVLQRHESVFQAVDRLVDESVPYDKRLSRETKLSIAFAASYAALRAHEEDATSLRALLAEAGEALDDINKASSVYVAIQTALREISTPTQIPLTSPDKPDIIPTCHQRSTQ